MSDYTIKIGVDSRSASRGVKQFAADLNGALKALRDFDKRAGDAFKALERFSKLNTGSLNKSVKTISAAVREINNLKVSRALVNNLQSLQKALSGLKFSGKNNLRDLPKALAGFQSIKINPRLLSTLVQMKATLKGFSGPPKSLQTLPPLLRQLASIRINASSASALAALKAALTGFTGPSPRAGANLQSLIQAMSGANAGHIAAVAAALQKMNGLSINVGRSLANIGAAGSRGFNSLTAGITKSHYAMRMLDRQTSLTYHAMTLLQAALGGLSVGSVVNGIYKVGTSFQSLERTLAAIATTSTETGEHLQFLNDMTTRIPVSLNAVAASYGKFAVAARLSGMSVEETQGIFEGFSTAFAAMGVSAETAEYGFLAIQQIISKGRVTMEEMRQQLGEHLPGAMQLLADSLNVPTSELIKMIENGEVGADAMIKFAARAQDQFGPALASAFSTASGQLIILQNSWTTFQRTVFESGFESGLAAMFKSLSDAMGTEDFTKFAQEVGKAFGRVFQVIGVFGAVLIENRDKVLLFLGAFAGWSALAAFAAILRFMLSPITLIGSAAGVAATSFRALGAALMFMASGGALKAIKSFFDFFVKRIALAVAGVLALIGTIYALAGVIDSVAKTNLQESLQEFGSDTLDVVTSTFQKMGGAVKDLVSTMDGGATDLFGDLMKESDAFAKQVQENDFENREQQAKNLERQLRNEDAKRRALTETERELWKQINPIAAATEEYQKQLALIDSIAAKTGANPDQLRKTLYENSKEDINPVGALHDDLKMELEAMKAKTAEQRAILEARRTEQDLIKKGIFLTQQQVDTIADYHKGIAMMNGELGNGIERWTATVGDFNDNLQEAIRDGIDGLSDEITNFVTGAEADFLGLARSILRTFVKISLDSLLKDLFGAMGMDGEKNGQSMAEQALSKLANIGENIMTAQTNVYTSGLSINGMPMGGPGSMANSPELPSKRQSSDGYTGYGPWQGGIERKPLAPISPAGTKADPVVITPAPMTTTQKVDRLAMPSPERFGYGIPAAPVAKPVTGASFASMPNLPAPTSNKDWINQMYARARAMGLSDAQARLMASQGALESGYGKSGLSTKANNFFGMKAGKSWTGQTITMPTKEQRADGSVYWENAKFRRYDSMEASIRDKEAMMARRWPNSQRGDTLDEAIDGLNLGVKGKGYATDTRYREKIHTFNRQIDPEMYKNSWSGKAPGQGLDPMATGGIDQVNQKLTTLGTTATTAGSQLTQADTKLKSTGSSAQQLAPALTQTQTAAQQAATAAQMKGTADQMQGMQTQMSGQSVGMAGQQASMASPQFQQAGTAIQSAGQSAAAGAAAAQTASPGLDGFGQGISQLLGPLASAIPGLGQFGSMIMQLVQSLFMGPGTGGGLFAEGGYATSPVSSVSLPSGVWANAPHYADGTANTSGGMPAVLHPNEAVIPLTRGREVPVEINDASEPRQDKLDKRGKSGVTIINLNGVTDMDSFKRSKRQLEYGVASAQFRSQFRNG